MLLLTISELNSLNYEEFISKTGNVVEQCPVLAAALWKYRPFLSFEDLMRKLKQIIQSLPLSGKILRYKVNDEIIFIHFYFSQGRYLCYVVFRNLQEGWLKLDGYRRQVLSNNLKLI